MTIRVSSSIANFRDKIFARYGLPEYKFPRDIFKSVCFFGMYHQLDYLRFIIHRGARTIFWCGSDILNLKRNAKFWRHFLVNGAHICENEAEALTLKSMGIDAHVQPIILDDPNQFQVCFKRSSTPKVYVSAHPGAEAEYGVNVILGIAAVCDGVEFNIYGVDGKSSGNVKFHGQVLNERFNREIKQYQAALRLNDFDGFAEVCAKALLMGQYVISRLPYPYVIHVTDTTSLINALNDLKNKVKPNLDGANYWRRKLNEPFL